jgi:hypothetical protein
MNRCERCETPTLNASDEYGEFVCDNCRDNEAEIAWERYLSDYYGGAGPIPLHLQQEAARKYK